MRCPASIPKGKWRDLWDCCLSELGDPTVLDLRLLERMVLNLVAADEALALAMKEPYVEGAKVQQVENPGFRVAARCDTQALAIARQLNLTQFVRSRAENGKTTAKRSEDPFDELDELAEKRASKAA